ncbi:hypothetical protein D9615_010369 [Tricholomella constricta]|uniref:Uncharacterized protein n=1 Tax=Tricholomella constricta TaxID=117010 RepID=A0A8H5GNR6_9AGAR|nr:hypothetical protein D9615_010369 [Tricholomella constricta]
MAPSPPSLTIMGRGARTKKPTWKLLERLPAAPTPLPPQPPVGTQENITVDDRDETPPPVTQLAWQAAVRTVRNIFGQYREYPTWPTHNPDDTVSLDDLSNTGTAPATVTSQSPAYTLPSDIDTSTADQKYHPFRNASVFWLMNWMWTGSPMKSILEMIKLVNFLKSDDFAKEDLVDFDIRKETAAFDNATKFQPPDGSETASSFPNDGWIESDVSIQVPDGEKHTTDTIPTFSIPELHYRSLVEVIKRTFSHLTDLHYTPFQNFWQTDGAGEAERIHDELFSSDAMLEAHVELQRQPSEPGCNLERVVAALMFWSDATHLANFGHAALWPIYLWFGNQSKWNRGKPSMGLCQHIAYIPKLPDSFEDDYFDRTGKPLSPELLTHCRRELLHAVWKCILDGTFMHAYKHGIVIECADGISRRFYPRIFTYSADYPEKVLLSTIRNFGRCPCSRCTIPKEKIPELGTHVDSRRRETHARKDTSPRRFNIRLAREFIYEHGYGVKSAAVERTLGADSSVPTENTFSILAKSPFNFFAMLAPDLLHEYELGVWKAVLIHLIRILVANGGNSAQAMNWRYRQVLTFGRSTIRRFSDNVTGLKKLAARNFEDLLQCAIPVFDGLLDDEDNDIIITLLFTLAEWHALAKLRLHTESTIRWLEQSTTDLGRQLRQFEKSFQRKLEPVSVAKHAKQQHLNKTGKRQRERTRGTARVARGRGAPPATVTAAPDPPLATAQQEPQAAPASEPSPNKKFNLYLIKLHALGDYASFIRRFGTTDSYSTQSGELEHRMVKWFYARTNKNRAARTFQATRMPKGATKSTDPVSAVAPPRVHPRRVRPTVAFRESEPLPSTPLDFHHHISVSRNFPIHLHSFILDNEGDPAMEDFYDRLQDHLLGRLLHPDWSGGPSEFSIAERRELWIANDRLYRHKVMRVNYTGYDV